jgi:hypothetical protein
MSDGRVRGDWAWLEIDAAAAQLPIAESSRLRPPAAAHFRRHAVARSLRARFLRLRFGVRRRGGPIALGGF